MYNTVQRSFMRWFSVNHLVLTIAMTGCSSNCNDACNGMAEAAQLQSFGSTSPLFSFGLLADIQYAPIPDGHSFSGSPRFYRHTLDVARHAADHFERSEMDLVVNLGDIVDGKCQDIEEYGGQPLPEGVDAGEECVDHVMDALSPYQRGKMLHSYGNHCLYNLSRETLQSKLGIRFVRDVCGDLVGYDDTHCVDGVRFVLLDSYDVALMRRCDQTSAKYRSAAEVLKANNPNFHENENSPVGLEGYDKRFVGFNGAVGEAQLGWLRATLERAREQGEKVVLLSHQPILPGSSGEVCLIWNYQEVLDVLREFGDVVVASLSGHAHRGGYKRDEQSGIHFRVVEAALESYPAMTYAMVDIFEDRMSIRGFGDCESAVYDFDHLHGEFKCQTKEEVAAAAAEAQTQ